MPQCTRYWFSLTDNICSSCFGLLVNFATIKIEWYGQTVSVSYYWVSNLYIYYEMYIICYGRRGSVLLDWCYFMDLIEIRVMLWFSSSCPSWNALLYTTWGFSATFFFTTNVSLTYQQHFCKLVCTFLRYLIAQCQQRYSDL